MSTSCEGIRVALKSCLIRSECVLKHNNLPSECLRDHFDELPTECKQLRQSLYECKKGMLDMRNRFRGNPGAKISNKLLEEQAQEELA
ncbi:SubName: Full=Uncharacterized protein {ECO:0000313/EMBL:CCA67215.1} [Serendipita indica DSM 11827]|uniref:Uncharacterized protein n=1 Tax=Serendipita indica (strain DSM 11827) TaxID=1109443 RepID=G4T7F6_SERID|nr:SubName: Full=Uncharacterized protein {ECO:0000313/EMBL:CCA67215.1} [Serendipita indica DSM 11827]CCA67215.1 hypothetical protein PIIN_01048 [Serendipita indica DSM 11827]